MDRIYSRVGGSVRLFLSRGTVVFVLLPRPASGFVVVFRRVWTGYPPCTTAAKAAKAEE